MTDAHQSTDTSRSNVLAIVGALAGMASVSDNPADSTTLRNAAAVLLALEAERAIPKPEGDAELRAMMRDPRYWRHRDPDIIRRVTEGFRRLVDG